METYEFYVGPITLTLLCISCFIYFCTVIAIIYYDLYLRWKKSAQSLVGQHIVITGGSSGIGKELAYQSVQRGAHVTIIARQLDKLTEVGEELKKRAAAVVKRSGQGGRSKVTVIQADVTKPEQVESAIASAEEAAGPIDILVNCAGYSYPSKLEDIPMDHLQGMMAVNYFGPVHSTLAVLPSMKARRAGRITFVSSIAGLTGLYGFTGYSASKFALRGFAEALQMEVKAFGISVTVSYPPDTNTPSLLEENKVKPMETVKIGETAGVFEPDVVARAILNDTLAGDFCSTVGIDGVLATIICAGMSPMSSVTGLVIQTLFQGPLRLVSLAYIWYFNRLVARCADEKEKSKKIN